MQEEQDLGKASTNRSNTENNGIQVDNLHLKDKEQDRVGKITNVV